MKQVFPLHDDSVSHTNLRHYLKQSCVRTLRGNEEVVQAVRYTFGEGVAYYFAFSDFYVRMLVFVAIVGVALSIVYDPPAPGPGKPSPPHSASH